MCTRKNKALIFDCDGTLVNSIPQAFEAICQVFKEAGVPVPSFEDFFANFCSPAVNYYRTRGVRIPDEKIWEIYLQHANHDNAELFPDTMTTLTNLTSRADELGIVYFGVLSANQNDIVQTLLEKRGIRKFFTEVKGDVRDKSFELGRIALDYHIEPNSVVWAGDLPSDMVDGCKAGVLSVGITQCVPNISTVNLRTMLVHAGADYCVKNLQELEGVLAKIL